LKFPGSARARRGGQDKKDGAHSRGCSFHRGQLHTVLGAIDMEDGPAGIIDRRRAAEESRESRTPHLAMLVVDERFCRTDPSEQEPVVGPQAEPVR
jgi:hypothetical protein